MDGSRIHASRGLFSVALWFPALVARFMAAAMGASFGIGLYLNRSPFEREALYLLTVSRSESSI